MLSSQLYRPSESQSETVSGPLTGSHLLTDDPQGMKMRTFLWYQSRVAMVNPAKTQIFFVSQWGLRQRPHVLTN